MGYYTSFNLEYEDLNPEPVENLEELINKYAENHEEMVIALIDNELNKWYEWEEDMIEMSKHFKNVLLTLSGAGEESGDLWTAYFFNGKSQVEEAQISYGPCTLDLTPEINNENSI
jgi:hypothetical protein